jgi:F-type H+-transporting ATPase subunit gamma
MSNNAASLKHKINSASDLKGVVRTMKAVAASSISQYEKSVSSLADYYRTVELGLSASLRFNGIGIPGIKAPSTIDSSTTDSSNKLGAQDQVIAAIVFGSDQGLVGQFNEDLADFAIKTLAALPGKPRVWAIGERVYARIADSGMTMERGFSVPTSVKAIAGLVRQIQSEAYRAKAVNPIVYVFHNCPKSAALYQPTSQRLLPLDQQWYQKLTLVPWPTKNPPEILCSVNTTIAAAIREYIFISLYRACAESLASENASRLAAMQRAEKNIDELLAFLTREFDQVRQSSIDEELSDVLAGYELLNTAVK